MADLQEEFWNDLLDYIQDRLVVPIIGSEFVMVQEGNRDVPLHCWLAQRLVADLELPIVKLPNGFDLHDTVSLNLRQGGERDELYAKIQRLLRNANLKPSESLRTLAGIPGFDLFVSLTFDSLLADALGATHMGAGSRAEQIAYSPSTVRDLPCPKAELRQPVVFHLLGRASASPDYVICDEDLLEFVHALQDKQRQPKILFDELRGSHLLILGCSFGDWLARFFLRTARGLTFSQNRRRWDVLVGEQIAHDARLTLFLETFSSEARVVPLTAARFVTELAQRWQAAHPIEVPRSEVPSQGRTGAKSMPAGTVFVSYAREDLEAAGRLAAGLRSAGLEVWFDKDALQMGDDWARSIRSSLRECSLFLPVISRRAMSEENRRRYFWREWNDADDFARGMAPDEAFIIPVVIDDTRVDRAPLPDSFKRAQARTLLDGKLTPDAAELLVELVRNFHRRQQAA